jgi:hypothetical protein
VSAALLALIGRVVPVARVHFDGSCEDNLQFLVLVRGMCDHAEPNNNDKDEEAYQQCTHWTQDNFWEVCGGLLAVACPCSGSTSVCG